MSAPAAQAAIPSSIVLGAFGRELLCERTMQPVLVIGPTGSGKTTTCVHPTLFASWGESAIVWDFKAAAVEDTGAARQRFGKVIVLDLARAGGPRYNPLMAVRPGVHLVPDCQHAARVITEGEREGHWRSAAFSYLTGVFVHLLTAGQDDERSLAGARRHVLLGDAGLERMTAAGAHPTARRAAQELKEKSAETAAEPDGERAAAATRRGGPAPPDKSLHYRKAVYVTCSVLLAELEDGVLEQQTASSDFSIADIVAGERPVTLFIVARPLDARRLRRVFKLILTQIVDFLTIERGLTDDGRQRHWRLLVVLDEFLQFHLAEAAEWIKYVREYGIRLLLLAQSLSEIEAEYGKGLVANCRLVVFRPNSGDEAERVSRMVGEAILEVPTRTTSRSALNLLPTVSRGVRVDRRPVLPMHAALELDGDDLIVFGYGKPIPARRLHPYADPRWRHLYGPPVLEAQTPPPGTDDRPEPAGERADATSDRIPLPVPAAQPRRKVVVT